MPKAKATTIPVIFCINAQYLKHVCVTISSILRHTPKEIPRPLEFYILADDISQTAQEIVTAIFQKWSGIVHFHHLPEPQPPKDSKTHGHCSNHSYSRYFIPEIFAEHYEKAIYLDADTIATGDIFSMFSSKMSGNEGFLVRIDGSTTMRDGLQTPHYFNSGVIGFNFKNLPSNFLQKCWENTKAEYPLGDQDALNALAIRENIVIHSLPKRFNAYPILHPCDNPIILHFIGYLKPWHNAPDRPFEKPWHLEKTYFMEKLKEIPTSFLWDLSLRPHLDF